jgi:LPS export ABC transporter protein LptC
MPFCPHVGRPTMIASRKLFQGVAVLFALGLTIMLFFGVWQGRSQKEQQAAVQTTDKSDAEMTLKDMEYTELQEGKRLWTIWAAEAKYFQDEQKTLLSSVRIAFFLESGDEVQLESREGLLHAGTKDIELWDAVHAVLPRGYQLFTERARYDHQKQTISSQALIRLEGPDVQLEGARWEYRIPDHRALIDGGVKGVLVFLPSKAGSGP